MATRPLNLNDRAMAVADCMAASVAELMIGVEKVGRARVVDAGVHQLGSLRAGIQMARACMADLAEVSIVPGSVGDITLPSVAIHVANPVAACMASQYAGWRMSVGDYFAMGSGPMRAAAAKEELFAHIGFVERPVCALGVLESAALPTKQVVDYIANACGVPEERLTLIVARTASIAGGVQVVARSVEVALHKLHELRFDLRRIVAGFGTAPLPPVAESDVAAIGRTNDAVLYGAEVTLYVTGTDDGLVAAGQKLPSSASRDYGDPFADVLARFDHDFYKIDPMLFSPAAVCLQNIETGQAHYFGKPNYQILRRSFFGNTS